MFLNPDMGKDDFSMVYFFISAAAHKNHEINKYNKNPVIGTSQIGPLLLKQ